MGEKEEKRENARYNVDSERKAKEKRFEEESQLRYREGGRRRRGMDGVSKGIKGDFGKDYDRSDRELETCYGGLRRIEGGLGNPNPRVMLV